MTWVGWLGWLLFSGAAIWLLLTRIVPAVIMNRQSALLLQQNENQQKQQEVIRKFTSAWNVVFQMQKVKLGIRLSAEGKGARLIAHHEDPVLEAEAQANLDELRRLVHEVRTGEENRKTAN
jgi:hypothetical protein